MSSQIHNALYAVFAIALLVHRTLSQTSIEETRHLKIDDDTELEDRTTRRHRDGATLALVFSDEFEAPGRSFGADDDPTFEALEKPDYSNQAIQFYNSSPSYVTTRDGSLVLTTRAIKTTWATGYDPQGKAYTETKNYTSGMVQTWNKFCFTGGVLELSIKLPGHADSGGLWPAVWLMGNLARASYDRSAMYKWPWSYDKCSAASEDNAVPWDLDKPPGRGRGRVSWDLGKPPGRCRDRVSWDLGKPPGTDAPPLFATTDHPSISCA